MSIDSYLGFAVKSGNIVYGIDNIKDSRKRKYLLVMSGSAAPNLQGKAVQYSQEKGIKLLTVENLESILHKENCKIVAILDKNMADAIVGASGGN